MAKVATTPILGNYPLKVFFLWNQKSNGLVGTCDLACVIGGVSPTKLHNDDLGDLDLLFDKVKFS